MVSTFLGRDSRSLYSRVASGAPGGGNRGLGSTHSSIHPPAGRRTWPESPECAWSAAVSPSGSSIAGSLAGDWPHTYTHTLFRVYSVLHLANMPINYLTLERIHTHTILHHYSAAMQQTHLDPSLDSDSHTPLLLGVCMLICLLCKISQLLV